MQVEISVSLTTTSEEIEEVIAINAQAVSVPAGGFQTEVTIPLTVLSDNVAGKLFCAFLKLLCFYITMSTWHMHQMLALAIYVVNIMIVVP